MSGTELNRLELDKERKRAASLLKTAEGQHALAEYLNRSEAGRALIKQQFGVTVIDAKQSQLPIVAILIPTHKKPENETGSALEKMIPFSRDKAHIIMRPSIASSVVHWVRNQLLASLYKDGTPFTHVLFMDDDMVPAQEALVRLLERNVDVIGAVCTVRQDPPLPNARHFNPHDMTFQTADIDRKGIWEVGAIGTGFMLISRKALDDVAEYSLKQEYYKKYHGMSDEMAAKREAKARAEKQKSGNCWWFEFLKNPNGEGEYGEDISFCLKAMECGYQIYADSSVLVGHIGNYPFSLEDYWAYRHEAVAEGKVVDVDKKPDAIQVVG